MFGVQRTAWAAAIAVCLCLTSVLHAQNVERLISYQGLLTQPSGMPVADGSYSIVLRLYDAASSGNLIYEEQQQVTVQKGLFNLLIGSQTTLAGVNFEQALWLETAIVGQTPFIPRTRLAVVPYAIRAEHATIADSLSVNFNGFVRSLNGAQGALTIAGENGIMVSRSGDTIRISQTEIGGAKIERIVSSDNTINVTNPTGPVADVRLANNAVTEEKIANGAVTSDKLAVGSVRTATIQQGSVTADKIAPGVIPTTLPPSGPAGGDLTGTYPNPNVAPNAITSSKIQDGTIANADLADGSVTSSKIADGQVMTTDLANNSVTSDKLANTTVIPGLYGSSLLVPRITVDEDGRITGVQQVPIPDIPYTGPAGGDLTGSYPNPTIRSLAITSDKIAPSAVDGSKIASNAVTTEKIANGTILGEDLAPGVIPTTLPPSGPAGGVLSGTYPNPNINQTQGTQLLQALNNAATIGTLSDARLNTTGVIPGTYGNGGSGKVARISVDTYGRLTNVVEQDILSATPSGNAGGDLQGTYPNPIINSSAAAGGRMVDALRLDFLAGDADINTANNIVMLDGLGRLPAVNGSQLTQLNASNISSGTLPIVRGGTNSSAPLQNNRIMVSMGGQIVESAPIDAGQILIGTSTSSLPAPGTITAGAGIAVDFIAPNFVVRSTYAKTLPGADPDQTMRWDDVYSQWVPNANILGTADGHLTVRQGLFVGDTAYIEGSTNIGGIPNTTNRFGYGLNSLNTMGSTSANNFILGNTYINTETDGETMIGNPSSPNSSTAISVGNNGNLELVGIDTDTMYAFLGLNDNRYVRQTVASEMALEGVVWQQGAFRLGGQTGTASPLLQDRFVNLDVHALSFTRINGAESMMTLDGGSGTVTIVAPTSINTVLANTTTIGNPMANTVIGGQLDPRGNITNSVGQVRIVDETEIIGPTFINSGTDDNVEIGQLSGTGNQSISISVGQGAFGNLHLHNIKSDAAPTRILTLDVNDRVRTSSLSGLADEGVQYQAGAFRLGNGMSTPGATQNNAFLEDRMVNVDEYSLMFSTGSSSGPGSVFATFNGNLGGAPNVTIQADAHINSAGPNATTIGNTGGGTVSISSSANVVIDPAGSNLVLQNIPNGSAADDILVITPSNQVRRYSGTPGMSLSRKTSTETRVSGFPIANDADLTVPVEAGGMYEITVFLMYSGSHNPESTMDVALTGPAAPGGFSYGVTTSGQAIQPSNVDGSGSVIPDLGTVAPPTDRQTVMITGLIMANANGVVRLQWGDDLNVSGETITLHANSFLKVSRVN